MLNTDRYKINNAKLVSRLTPFFLRGKKAISFLRSIIAPIENTHINWRRWALGKTIEAAATSQPIVLKWYLKKMIAPYMSNSNDEFSFQYTEGVNYLFLFENDTEQTEYQITSSYWSFEDEADEDNVLSQSISGVDLEHLMFVSDITENISEHGAELTVFAPSHISSISDIAYKSLVVQCVEKYLVYDINYSVTITA